MFGQPISWSGAAEFSDFVVVVVYMHLRGSTASHDPMSMAHHELRYYGLELRYYGLRRVEVNCLVLIWYTVFALGSCPPSCMGA